jgi:hypothetical protein
LARYAENTEVPVERSKAEIEKLIARYGGSLISFGWRSEQVAVLGFRWRERMIKFEIRMPDPKDYQRTARNLQRTRIQVQAAVDAETRRRWRVLLIRLKVKFETVDSEPDLWEEEFLANVLLPDGKTVGRWLQPQLEQAYITGQMPKQLLLLAGPDGE